MMVQRAVERRHGAIEILFIADLQSKTHAVEATTAGCSRCALVTLATTAGMRRRTEPSISAR